MKATLRRISRDICLGAAAAVSMLAVGASVQAQSFSEPLPVEPLLVSETLPADYPDTWVFAHDIAFNSLTNGRAYIVDAAAKNADVLGMVDVHLFGNFLPDMARKQLYVSETFYSHGNRGTRTDVLTIYDTATLAIKAQVNMPGNKRGMSVTLKNSLQLSNDGKFLFVYYFTPAASVGVFDIEANKFISEIMLPGCTQMYPSGARGFASMCADGTLIAFDLDEAGKATQEYRTKVINTIDEDPFFMPVGRVGETFYFLSFNGDVQPVTLAGGAPKLAPRIEAAALYADGKKPDVMPSGWQVLSSDNNGMVYMLMRPGAAFGDHKFGGSQVFVMDPEKKKIVKQFALKSDAISLEITGGDTPLLVVTDAAAMDLHVYDAATGEYLRNIGGLGSATPFTLHAAK